MLGEVVAGNDTHCCHLYNEVKKDVTLKFFEVGVKMYSKKREAGIQKVATNLVNMQNSKEIFPHNKI